LRPARSPPRRRSLRARSSRVVEARNYSITLQRQAIYDTPSYQAKLSTVSLENLQNALRIQASDPERVFVDDLC
jgi:hypothetical protein